MVLFYACTFSTVVQFAPQWSELYNVELCQLLQCIELVQVHVFELYSPHASCLPAYMHASIVAAINMQIAT